MDQGNRQRRLAAAVTHQGAPARPTHEGAPGRPSSDPRGWPPRRTISGQLAAMLATVRRRRGYSLREAARRSGCTAGTIVHLEKARRAPSIITAWGIINGYRLDDTEAEMLLAEAVDNAGKSSPYRR